MEYKRLNTYVREGYGAFQGIQNPYPENLIKTKPLQQQVSMYEHNLRNLPVVLKNQGMPQDQIQKILNYNKQQIENVKTQITQQDQQKKQDEFNKAQSMFGGGQPQTPLTSTQTPPSVPNTTPPAAQTPQMPTQSGLFNKVKNFITSSPFRPGSQGQEQDPQQNQPQTIQPPQTPASAQPQQQDPKSTAIQNLRDLNPEMYRQMNSYQNMNKRTQGAENLDKETIRNMVAAGMDPQQAVQMVSQQRMQKAAQSSQNTQPQQPQQFRQVTQNPYQSNSEQQFNQMNPPRQQPQSQWIQPKRVLPQNVDYNTSGRGESIDRMAELQNRTKNLDSEHALNYYDTMAAQQTFNNIQNSDLANGNTAQVAYDQYQDLSNAQNKLSDMRNQNLNTMSTGVPSSRPMTQDPYEQQSLQPNFPQNQYQKNVNTITNATSMKIPPEDVQAFTNGTLDPNSQSYYYLKKVKDSRDNMQNHISDMYKSRNDDYNKQSSQPNQNQNIPMGQLSQTNLPQNYQYQNPGTPSTI